MSLQETVATYFKSLNLKNVKCFENVSLDLTDESGNIAQWTLLLGDNGVGKTTLLQCLCWMRPTFEENNQENTKDNQENLEETTDNDDLSESIKTGKLKSVLTVESNSTLEALLRINKTSELRLDAELCQGFELNSSNIVVRPTLKSNKIKTGITLHDKEGILSKDPDEDKINIEEELGEFWEPFIVAYGANRWANLEFTGENRIEDPLAANLSIKGTELKDAEKELITLYHAAEDKKTKRLEEKIKQLKDSQNTGKEIFNIDNEEKSNEERLLEIFIQTIAKVLPDELNVKDNIKIEPPEYIDGELKNAELKLNIMGKDVPFSELSLGYQTTLTWVLDLSWQLFMRYPKSENPRLEPAIVIIDEIDLHLHPHWQWTIMKKLAEWFPRTQFIGTSHSPLMVQSTPNANFAIVKEIDKSVEIENTPEVVKGWRVDQILNSEYFGFEPIWDSDTEAVFEERRKLLHNTKRSSYQEARLKELEKQIISLPTENDPKDRKAMDLIQRAAEALKTNFKDKI